MADTGRTRAALITLFADNTTKAITPQIARDFIVSSMPVTVAKTTTYTATLDDAVILAGGTSSWTLSLPAAATSTGKMYWIKKTSASIYTITVNANASETIDGALTQDIVSQYTCLCIICDGSNWWII